MTSMCVLSALGQITNTTGVGCERCGVPRKDAETAHGRTVFFKAEDDIRDIGVTGVQTCALPILCAVAGERGRAPSPSGSIVEPKPYRRRVAGTLGAWLTLGPAPSGWGRGGR